ncbi:MAG TPA: FAD-binding oxidoreductase [Burkholderiales bacterium]|nr:FAD-binding oxidoreductase [Burkholderiales bacterium]
MASVNQKSIDELRARLRGPLLVPGDSEYDASRTVWNAMIDRRPALIARCLGTADVATGLRFARECGLPLSIKGGGHNVAGLATCDEGLMLDMSLMRGVWVDPGARTARAQAGCLLGDVDRETQVHGLAATLGFVSNTGIAGLTLGGGFGYLTRRSGWTSDNLLSVDVVTADGRARRASEEENSDLFWGLRGGGGNFGIATSFEYRLDPVGPEIAAGAIAWNATEASRVLEIWRRLVSQAPPELSCPVVLRLAPPAPWIAKEFHGKPVLVVLFCHSGRIDEGGRLAAPLKAFGSPVGDVLQCRSYASQQSLLDATQPKGRRYYWKSEFLPRLEQELLAKAAEHAGRIVSPHSAIILFPIDGALNRLPESHSAVGNRDAAAVINITAAWENADDDNSNIEWARAAWRDLRRFSTGGTYVNFLTEEEGDERTHAAYRDNYRRLVEIKTRWDPDNVFRINKNIAPQAAPS